LDEAVVDDNKVSAKQLVQEALEKIRDNYSTEPFVLEGFFRDWSLLEHADSAKRNEGTLLEAAVSIYDNGYSANRSNKPQETIYLKEIRRGLRGENWLYTWNSLDALLKQNYLHHPQSKAHNECYMYHMFGLSLFFIWTP
jgi:hypothetical protein